MAKKKSKLKKILGGVAAAATAAALMRGKDKGAVTADMPRSMVPTKKRMVQGLNYEPSDNYTDGINKIAAAGGVANLRKGGRVGCGKAKRGFGRAMKGRK